MSRKTHVAVLMGGLSSERDVSISSGTGIKKSLKNLGYKVTAIDPDRNLAKKLKKVKPDIVFIALHGLYGEDGCIQGLLEVMGIPYTHSGVLASAVAMDKLFTISTLKNNGILCPVSKAVSHEEILSGKDLMPKPYVIKPSSEGSTIGVFIFKGNDNDPVIRNEDLVKFKQMMVEQYIPGKELTVAVSDEKPLAVIEIRPKQGFYDYKNKYVAGSTEYIVPAPIPKKIYDLAMETAFKAHKILGCRGVSRSDFRYDEEGDGKLYFLELNTHPGFTPTSLVPKAAAHLGLSYDDLVEYLVKGAKCEK